MNFQNQRTKLVRVKAEMSGLNVDLEKARMDGLLSLSKVQEGEGTSMMYVLRA